MSQTPPSPEPHTMLGQRHTDRYSTLRKDVQIDQLDHSFGKPSLAAGLANVNPFTSMTVASSTPQLTFEELNANCPDANRPSFDPESLTLDKLPNINGIATVTETSKVERELIGNIKLTAMSSLTTTAIQKLLDETSTVQYVTNPLY